VAGLPSAPRGELASVATGDREAQAVLRLECRGVVQGVGLRPALQRLAGRLGLSGSLSNAAGLVRLELQGRRRDLERFLQELPGALPPAAHLEPLQPQWLEANAAGAPAARATPAGPAALTSQHPPFGPSAISSHQDAGTQGLRISAEPAPSAGPQAIGLFSRALVADCAPCAACLRELADPHSRRHGDPFLACCCCCGPRFSIATAEPWQREHTTQARFPPCESCALEWADPADRRFHAEAISCPCCGPRLMLQVGSEGRSLGTPPPPQGVSASDHHAILIAAATRLLEQGQILALQGVGGFQLLVDASNPRAVARLRRRKRRPIKPLALLVAEPAWIGSLLPCPSPEPGGALLMALTSPAAPIVLLPRLLPHRDGGGQEAARAEQREVAPAGPISACAVVAPCSAQLGVMLPASALHHLLVRRLGRPLVCTSGNRSGEPLCTDPLEARQRLAGIADAFLSHDRPIVRPLEDSLLQLIDGRPALLRRARGYAPEPLRLPVRPVGAPQTTSPGSGPGCPEPEEILLALGGDLKSAPALACGERVWLAPHLGDLAEARTQARLRAGLEELLHAPGPERIACDAHPGYLSHQLASQLGTAHGMPLLAVPHHEAHALAVIAEHGLVPPVLAFCADGLGYGEPSLQEGSASAAVRLRGGELLLIGEAACTRIACLRPFPLPGGERACREPRRSALGLLAAAGPRALEHPGARHSLAAFTSGERALLLQLLGAGVASPWCTSLGRLFDAVASLLGVCQRNGYEGEAAQRLQALGAAAQALSEHQARDQPEDGYPFPCIGSYHEPRPAASAPAPMPAAHPGSDPSSGAAQAALAGTPALATEATLSATTPQPTQPTAPIQPPDPPPPTPLPWLGWLDWQPALEALLADRAAGVPRQQAAARLHLGLADGLAGLLAQAAAAHGCREVVLAGGCFQNGLLLEALIGRLRRQGLRPHWSQRVPASDGGLALGQLEALRREALRQEPEPPARQPRG